MTIPWLWQHPDWPRFHWQDASVQPLLREARLKLGILLGKAGLGTTSSEAESALETLIANIISSSAIENEVINAHSLRSSLARKLGLPAAIPDTASASSEGLSSIMLDAINNLAAPLDQQRLLQWHDWLFAHEGRYWQTVQPGTWRGDEAMQLISGRLENPTIHFEAPPRAQLEMELDLFIDWFNRSQNDVSLDPLLRAAITHLWFITLHPFEDGNGRITRALTDLALAQNNQHSLRLYAMSVAILQNRRDYYLVLEQSQRGTTDITVWLEWFLRTLMMAMDDVLIRIERTLAKNRFWQQFHHAGLAAAQVKVLNRLLDGGDNGFAQGISAAQYGKVTGTSKATATRHLADLVEKGCLQKLPGGGRSTRYSIKA